MGVLSPGPRKAGTRWGLAAVFLLLAWQLIIGIEGRVRNIQ